MGETVCGAQSITSKMSGNPRIWCCFVAKSEKSDVKLRIEDASSDRINDVADFFAKYFATQETFHKIAGVGNSTEALEECREFVTEMINDKNTRVIICCKDGDGSESSADLIAASMVTLEKKDEPEDFDIKPRTKEMARMFEVMGSVFDRYDAMKELGLDSFYDDRGVVVHPDYRGLGIAQRLFNTRRKICKAEGIPMTGAWMTSFGSQKAAERDGWETAFEVPYEELSKQFEVTFEGVPSTCKFMIAEPI